MGLLKSKMGKKKEMDVTTSSDGEGENERGTWDSPVEFVLSCLGYAVGLGNVWRFPYMCFENGGGAFLIPYVIMLVFVGLPIFFIELSAGQYASSGPMTVWEASPIFQGVGAGTVVISFISNIYYNMIIAWSLYYLFASWQKTLPWSGCTHDYNTAYCYSKTEATDCEEAIPGSVWLNKTCYNGTYIGAFNDTEMRESCNITQVEGGEDIVNCWNETYNPFSEWLSNETSKRVSASEEYFNFGVLDRSPIMSEPGYVKWDITLVLLLAWILCFFCVIKGIKSSGKVVYFTATFPYLIIIILLIRGALLEGALEGIKFYIIPDWDKLKTPKVWADAAGQIFFSLSVGMGGLMTFASYNKFHNNVLRDTLIVTIGNCLTSFIAGFAIFSILGHLAHVLKRDVTKVAKSGSGLAFVAYPEVVTYLEPPQLWASLFFFMLITLGIDSQMAGLENCMTAIVDLVPRLRPHKTWVSLAISVVCFLLGLSMCTQAGVYWLDLMGYYSSGWSLILIGLAEGIVFPWVYGAKRLKDDIELMVGFCIGWHWWFCWKFISPVLLIAILIFNIIDFTPLSYGDYLLPDWAQGIGWLMAVASIGMIPIFAVIRIIMSYYQPEYTGLSFGKRLLKLTRPTDKWNSYKNKASGQSMNGAIESPPPYEPTQGHANPAYTKDNTTEF